MYGREELPPQTSQGIGNPEPGRIVRYGHYHVDGLDREHTLEHLHVPEDRKPPHAVGDCRMGVVVETGHAISQLTSKQNVQRDPPVPASPHYGDSHLFIECQTLHLDFGFRYASSGFGLSYLPLLPTGIAPRHRWKFSTIAGMLLLYPHHAPTRGGYPGFRGIRLAEHAFERVSEKKFTGREASASGCLELQHLQGPITAIHRNATVLGLYSSDLLARALCIQHRGAPDLERT